YVRHVGPYDEVGGAWKALMTWGWKRVIFGKPTTFGLCFDDPEVTSREQVRYEACMVVPEKVTPRGAVQVRDLEAGTWATTLHEGPYSSLGTTYARLFAHVASESIEGRRWRLGDPPTLEVYLNDPRKTPPERLRTEVGVRVIA
ncbi:MAG: GyrI-like domain-containing protein, partial [Phycisphaerales bacterium]|nr:GyrI-like domain-containing protein [Phycisphaerales bacterium]